nr:SNF2-related protein [Hymenobacter nivis]
MGLGKAQPLHANILTPGGWKQMGEMRVGDAVINSQGTASRVTGVFPQGEKEIFRVMFTDGATAECCAEHLWAVQSPVQKCRGQGYQVRALHELAGNLYDRHGNTKWFIPMVKPVAMTTQPVPVEPYFMGLLLGDGCFRQNSVQLSMEDAEIVNYVALGLPPGLAMRQQGTTCDYRFVKTAAGWTNDLMQQIGALGLKGKGSKDKFIPDAYLFNDAATRLAVLQGLMDSDGYMPAPGDVCQFTSVSVELIKGVTFLVQSLGGTVKESSKIPTYTHNGARRTGQLAYALTLSLPPHIQPFRLARKAALYRPKSKYQPCRGIKAVELVGTMPAQCIAVDAPDRLYVTDNFVLTHNTIQTLAMLQQRAESGAAQGAASLLALPTSLVYNWLSEAQKFTPALRLLVYTGTYRTKDVAQFAGYDVVLTSYGIVRLDAELLASYRFDYVILDESQAIKNPSSTTSQAVRQLRSKHRLILTGTPVENSTMDLWSQMSFINPGLLGTQAFFRKEFLKPIEQHRDEGRMRRLHALIKPFILRRHKEQVAKELPAKTEQLSYCDMTPEQAQAYEETKSFYRNKILQNLDEHGSASTQFLLLQGLTRLRQMANHPHLADATYTHESGKLREVLRMVRNVVAEGHKVLVFSQFVQHLALVRAALDERQLPYAYLDGNTRDRAAEVARFQETDALQIFLISLKAGGVGLNLTAADYVFLLDPWWNPAVEAQAVDRAHRIGQQRPVFVYKFITQHTVEEKILALQQRKLNLVSELIATDEAVIKTLTRADIEELLG